MAWNPSADKPQQRFSDLISHSHNLDWKGGCKFLLFPTTKQSHHQTKRKCSLWNCSLLVLFAPQQNWGPEGLRVPEDPGGRTFQAWNPNPLWNGAGRGRRQYSPFSVEDGCCGSHPWRSGTSDNHFLLWAIEIFSASGHQGPHWGSIAICAPS